MIIISKAFIPLTHFTFNTLCEHIYSNGVIISCKMSIQTQQNSQTNDYIQAEIIEKSKIEVPNYYEIDSQLDNLIYEEKILAGELENYLIESLIQDIFYSNNYIMKVHALQQLTSWIDKKQINRIFKIIAKKEKDSELREFAKNLLEMEL